MIRVAVIGAGVWGPNLIRNFHNRQQSIVTLVADRDPARLREVTLRFPDIEVSESAERVCQHDDVDAVVVASPTATHYAFAKAALESGKHVLVEKPLTAESAEAVELQQLADARERILMVGHIFLYNAGVRRVKEYLDAGHLGRIFYISMVRTNLGPIRTDTNAAWDLASHDLSIANYWLGTGPCSVSALGGAWVNPGIEDAVFATLRYPSNVLINLHVSWLNPRKSRDITVVGEHCMLTFDDMHFDEPIRVYNKSVTAEPGFVDSFVSFRASVRDGDITIPKVAMGEPLSEECQHFLQCIAEKRKPLTGAPEAIVVIRALEAMQRSVRSGGREVLLS